MANHADVINEFLQSSKAAEQARAQAEKARILAAERRKKRTIAGLVVGLLLLTLLTVLTRQQAHDLETAATRDARQASELQQQSQDLESAATKDALQSYDLEIAATTDALRLLALSTSQAETERERDTAQAAESTAQAERTLAQEKAAIARSREIAAIAASQLEFDAERSLLLAMEALKAAYTVQAEEALRRSLAESRARVVLFQSSTELSWSPSASQLAIIDQSGRVQLWDMVRLERTSILQWDQGRAVSVAWNPRGNRLAAAARDGTVWLWDVQTGQVLDAITGYMKSASDLAWAPDGQQLAVGGCARSAENRACWQGSVLIWNVLQASEPALLDGLDCGDSFSSCDVRDVAWSPKGDTIAAGLEDGSIRLWSATTLERISALDTGSSFVVSIAWDPLGKKLAALLLDDVVQIWDVETESIENTRVSELSGASGYTVGLTWSPNGKWLAFIDQDRRIKLWNIKEDRELLLTGHTDEVEILAWSPDSQRLASASDDGTIRVWSMKESGDSILLSKGMGYPVDSVSWNPQGTQLAFDYYALELWNVNPEKWITLAEHRPHFAVAWDPGGTRLAMDGDDNTIHILNTADPEEELVLEGHVDIVLDLAWKPDGVLLASVSGDHTVRIWDAESGKEIEILKPAVTELRGNTPGSVAWSPNGELLTFSLQEPVFWLWDLQKGTGTPVDIPESQLIYDLAWNPDGEKVASASGSVHVWEATTGRELFALSTPYLGRFQGIYSIAWSPDGGRLACGYSDGTIRLWDVGTRRQTVSLMGHTKRVLDLAWSPDGKRLASGSEDFSALIFYTDIQDLLAIAQEQISWQIYPNEDRQRRELTPEEKYLYLDESALP